jgi:hypothetical protein
VSDLDTRIRSTVMELLNTAPPPPPLPSTTMEPPHRRGRARVAVALVSAAALVAGTFVVVANRSSDDARIVTSRARVPAASVVHCSTVIGSDDRVGARRTVVLGRVALSTKSQALQANHSGDADPASALYAKDGLLVKRLVPVELIVPRRWRDRLSLEWGDSARTEHLKVTGCPASTPGARWLAFAGGYYVAKPVCAPLIVKVGDRTQRVRIGIGRACPGQRPAPPGN